MTVRDMFDDEDDENFEDEPEESGMGPLPGFEPPRRPEAPPTRQPAANSNGRNLRVRPMKPRMSERYPGVVSVLLTYANGKQCMLVRGA